MKKIRRLCSLGKKKTVFQGQGCDELCPKNADRSNKKSSKNMEDFGEN